ncbi:MAG TPA: stage II sporulation protein M [Chthonomonadaceae bacterium]|nr:stage II sporulation protein M [Chthonomonadaceae bacterium]
MDERDFVTKKRTTWDRLAALVEKAGGKQGIRALSREELLALGPLYRRVSSDLAYARAHATSSDLVQHLNGLVGRAHALLYEAETSGSALRSLRHFYGYEFPTLLQRHARSFLAAVALTLIGVVFAYWLVLTQPDKIGLFIPEEFKSSAEVWKSGKVEARASAAMSGFLMTHNLQIGLLAFASGVVAGVPTAFLLFYNGGMLGAMAALMTQVHHHNTFWPGIVPHGIAELTAIFICGAAGLLIGVALLVPGAYTRRDALKLAGLDAIKLVLGTIPLFIFAGIVEGMFSHLGTPAWFRIGFAALNGVMWYLYLFLPRRKPDWPDAPQLEQNLQRNLYSS